MWIFEPNGFFSIVENRDNPEEVIIRARFKTDLENLSKKVTFRSSIIKTLNADYHYRAFADKTIVANYLFNAALNIDYLNFKSTIKNANRHSLYLDVWDIMRKAQDDKPSKGKAKKKNSLKLKHDKYSGFNLFDAKHYV